MFCPHAAWGAQEPRAPYPPPHRVSATQLFFIHPARTCGNSQWLDSTLALLRAWVRTLVGELKSHKLCHSRLSTSPPKPKLPALLLGSLEILQRHR